MKKILFLLLSVIASVGFLHAQITPLDDVEIPYMPKTVEEFVELRDEIATNPQGGAAMFILALKMYAEDVDLARKCLIVMVDKSVRSQHNDFYKGYDLRRSEWNLIDNQLYKAPYLPNSYIKGSSPGNGYEVEIPYVMEFQINSYSGELDNGMYKLFVKSSGADSARPMRLKKNDKGIWKAVEWSSVIVGIRKPEVDDTDDL